jgi:hypothetical protein
MRTPEDQSLKNMAADELIGLPVSFDLDTANRALALGRTTGYALAKRGDYPVRVLRLGRQYRVTRYDLLRFLGFQSDAQTEGDAE